LSNRLLCSIGDQGLKNIGEGLKGFSSLQSISLRLNDCDNITNQGLIDFGEGFRGFDSLDTIFMRFYSCEKITKNGIKMFREVLPESFIDINIKLR